MARKIPVEDWIKTQTIITKVKGEDGELVELSRYSDGEWHDNPGVSSKVRQSQSDKILLACVNAQLEPLGYQASIKDK